MTSCASVFGASPSSGWAAGAILLGLVLVGMADSAIDPQIRLFPLYFLPLVAAAWRFGRCGALVFSVLASVCWIVAAYLSGGHYARGYFWVINVITQLIVFLTISLLVAYLRDALARESEFGHKDALTGLSNRRAFFQRAGDVLALCHRNRRPIALAVLDLDNFKGVNDRHGHEAGDLLLTDVAGAMTAYLRSSDIVARLGGDEFLILLPESDRAATAHTLEKLRAHLEQLPSLAANGVSASIGAVAYASAPADLSAMVRTADALMYRAKADGRNRVEVQEVA